MSTIIPKSGREPNRFERAWLKKVTQDFPPTQLPGITYDCIFIDEMDIGEEDVATHLARLDLEAERQVDDAILEKNN